MLFYDMLYTCYYSVSGKVHTLYAEYALDLYSISSRQRSYQENQYLTNTCTYVLFLCKHLFVSTFPTQTPDSVLLPPTTSPCISRRYMLTVLTLFVQLFTYVALM